MLRRCVHFFRRDYPKNRFGFSLLIILALLLSSITCAFIDGVEIPLYEIPVNEPELDPQYYTSIPPPDHELPKISIILDDVGYDRDLTKKFLSIDAPIAFSVLPFSPFQKQLMDLIHEKGKPMMLHIPMEPIEYPDVKPGLGALISSMPPDEMLRNLEDMLDATPGIIGANNHMGSKLTAMPPQMYQILTILKQRKLFFVDSRTSLNSVVRHSAKLLHVPFGQRDVFLDAKQDSDFIRKQLRLLYYIALKQGEAIGICHPYPETYEVLSKELPKLKKKAKLVPIIEVIHTPG